MTIESHLPAAMRPRVFFFISRLALYQDLTYPLGVAYPVTSLTTTHEQGSNVCRVLADNAL